MKLTLDEFATAKGFSAGDLTQFGVRATKAGSIIIPYYDAAGNQYVRYRIRKDTADGKGFAWNQADAPIIPYGLHRPIPYTKGAVTIVEGESDCWALWKNDIPALGIAGASNVGSLQPHHLKDVEQIFVVQEPGEAGERFPHRIASQLYDKGFEGSVFAVQLPLKDPRAMMIANGEQFYENFREAVRANRRLVPRQTTLLGINIKPLSSYHRETVSWAWNQRIPIGKPSILAGDGGEGKSFVTMAIGAALTTGAELPGGSPQIPCDVLYWNGEDAPEDTLLWRAEACGANLARMQILEDIDERGGHAAFTLAHVPLLERALEGRPTVRLVVIDPITALMASFDGHTDTSVRSALQPFVDMARRRAVGVLFVMHLKKGETSRALHRLNGSVAFGALGRSVMYLGTHAFSGRKGIDTIKHNLALSKPMPVEFRLDSEQGVVWMGTSRDLSADVIEASYVAQNRVSRGPSSQAIEFLRERLLSGERDAKSLRLAAEERGISGRTLDRAKQMLNVKAVKHGNGPGSRWFWRLPTEDETMDYLHEESEERHENSEVRLEREFGVLPRAPSGSLHTHARAFDDTDSDLLLDYANKAINEA